MTYNEFSQITPFPTAWDVTSATAAAGSGGCSSGAYGAASTDAACTSVYNFLNGQSGNISSFASSPIWSIVDGPYTIAASKGGSFNSSGAITLVPNTSYSGTAEGHGHGAGAALHDRQRRVQRPAGRRRRRGLRPAAGHHAEHIERDQSRSEQPAADQLLPLAVGPLRLQLRRRQVRFDRRRRECRRHLQAALLPAGPAEHGRPAGHDQQVPQGLRRPDLRAGAGAPEEQPGRRVRAVEPVPLQPVARQEPPDLARVEGGAQRHRHLPEAGDGAQATAEPASPRVRS